MTANDEDFARIIAATPLVSIDLILRNPQGQILLGYRRNRPAQDTWFVPGGRIRKNERLADAWRRIARVELGITLDAPRLLGVYEHLYDDNALDLPGVGTHYVVLACEADLPAGAALQPDQQHAQLHWWEIAALLASPDVHANTKAYFEERENAFSLR